MRLDARTNWLCGCLSHHFTAKGPFPPGFAQSNRYRLLLGAATMDKLTDVGAYGSFAFAPFERHVTTPDD
jgi:hypothetical protein